MYVILEILSHVAHTDFCDDRIGGMNKHFRCAFCLNKVVFPASCIARCLDTGSMMLSGIQALSVFFLPFLTYLFSSSVLPVVSRWLLFFRPHILVQGGEKGEVVAAMSASCIRGEKSFPKAPTDTASSVSLDGVASHGHPGCKGCWKIA